MSDEHARYQQLAVGHVLGGLAPEDAAAFRDHLTGCHVCRARVAELRGIASDLARAERDERARALVETDVEVPTDEQAPRREPPGPGADAGRRRRGVTVAVSLGIVLLIALSFWNLHLRTGNALLADVVDRQTETLQLLADGTAVSVQARHPVRGRAAVDGERVALALAGIAAEPGRERVVLWLRDGGDAEVAAQVAPGRLADGHLALTLDDQGARTLVATLEAGQLGDEPDGERLATVDLRPGG